MDEISIYIQIVVAILGVAYPILLQVVASLDEKYSSILIVELFNSERAKKFFVAFLISALLSILIWTLKLSPIVTIDGFDFFVENSASYLVIITTVLLVVSFFCFVNKILVYYTPTKFLRYLMDNHVTKNDVELRYFKAITDILIQSIKQQNETIAQTISKFMSEEFRKQREQSSNQAVEYPYAYYEIIEKATEELALVGNKKLAFLEDCTVGGRWLLSDLNDHEISEKTYRWLWRNLIMALKYEKDDMVMYYWQRANNVFDYDLAAIMPECSEKTFEEINHGAILNREDERKRFLEFQYALGGLLMYKERYNCLTRIFRYTLSVPPKYELLPDTIDEIFNTYIRFRDPFERNYPFITDRYYFPEQEGLNADGIIKKWICKYIALLFLRQYTIHPHLITMKPLAIPSIPETQREKRIWIDNVDYFKLLVNEVLGNPKLLSSLGLEFITPSWCEENQKPQPYELLDTLKKRLTEEFEKTQIGQEISQEKVKRFNESTNNILSETIRLYCKINNPERIESEYDHWFFRGLRVTIDKSALADNQDASISNYDSFFAKSISDDYQRAISETLFFKKTKSYLLKHEEVFSAVDRLKIDNENYLIVGFRNNLSYYIKTLGVRGLTEESYKGVDIISYPVCNNELVGGSFFVLRKSDLPQIIYNRIDDAEIEKYLLNLINETFNLYTSIVDLNQSLDLLKEIAPTAPEKDLRKSVLLNISFLAEIRWKKNVEVIQISSYSKYRERGLLNKVIDVKAIQG